MLIDSINPDDLTPAMKQFVDIKLQHRDAIVLFRMGDFYETFYDDAIESSDILGITLTSRKQGDGRAPLAGIPYHAIDNYLKKYVDAGKKVVIVEQLEDPKTAKGVVKRGITRIITPGTLFEDSLLQATQNNYLMSIFANGDDFGFALCDVSTGEVLISQGDATKSLIAQIEKFSPTEILISPGLMTSSITKLVQEKNIHLTTLPNELFELETSLSLIHRQFGSEFDAEKITQKLALSALGPLVSYVRSQLQQKISYLSKPKWYSLDEYMLLDNTTQRNLELLSNTYDGSIKGTLFSVLQKTITSSGTRLLKKYIVQPLLEIQKIKQRQQAVQMFYTDAILRDSVRSHLRECGDIERLGARASFGSIQPKEVVTLSQSLKVVQQLKKILSNTDVSLFSSLHTLSNLQPLIELIDKTIKDDPSTLIRDGNIIRDGVHKELDELRNLATNSKEWLRSFEDQERQKTGIKSLKIKYNRVFGYFIEVTKTNIHLVPNNYIRKQTQVNAERYITDELKDQEAKILGARERINSLEHDLFQKLISEIVVYQDSLKQAGSAISYLDVMQSFATCSVKQHYVCPDLFDNRSLQIVDGRHPVIEMGTDFISNNTEFDIEDFVHIITGPNMAGKSTYLRQIAQIVLLAQIGSFIPATSAKIGIVDRIFTRVGASDNLLKGESTFMVEMTETANILQNATEKSLVLLDEVGRGTSTYDGFSLAWAITEHLLYTNKSKTLFATHYHQLNTLANTASGVKNYHSLIEEVNDELLFLRKIVPGSTDKSFGVHVAKLAGLPSEVIVRATEIMQTLEQEDELLEKAKTMTSKTIQQKENKTNNNENTKHDNNNPLHQLHLTKF